MTTNFPASLDTFVDPVATQGLPGHAAQHSTLNDAMAAVEKQLVGPAVFNVKGYGAKGDGTTNDTTAIQSAITAAYNAGGGRVFCPAGTYVTTGTLLLRPGVSFVGVQPMTQLTMGDSTVYGTIFKPTSGGAFDFLAQNTGEQLKGAEIGNFAVDGAVGSGNWLIHLYGFFGGHVHDIGNRSAVAGNNFFNLDGGTAGAYGNIVRNLSCTTGLGYRGGTGYQLGTGSGNANANTFIQLTALGYTLGMAPNLGGGNTYLGMWMQSCTTGAQFQSSLSVIEGGWFESNTTDIVFGASSVNNVVRGLRCSSGPLIVTTGGSGNRIEACDGYGLGHQTPPAIPASGSALTNPFPFDTTVFVSGGTVSAVAIGGSATGLTSGAFRVPAGQTITLTYTVAPTWQWFGG